MQRYKKVLVQRLKKKKNESEIKEIGDKWGVLSPIW
jgi:hypothetical protein